MNGEPEDLGRRLADAIGAWNLYALPALLLAVAVASAWARRRGAVTGVGARDDRRLALRRLGLAHYGMALWALTTVAAEVREYYDQGQGIFPSNPITGVYGSAVSAALNLPVGFALRRLWWPARWASAVLWALRVVLGVSASQYAAFLDASEWPRFAASWVLPVFALVLLLSPGTGRAFRGGQPAPERPGRFDATLAVVALLFAVVVGSVVLTDAADWAVRTAAGPAG